MNSPTTTVTTVRGNWCRASSSANLDLETQRITGSYARFTLPSAPQPGVRTSAPTRTPHGTNTRIFTSDPIDDFFGVSQTRATRESRHDSRLSVGGDSVLPSSYMEELPAYSAESTTEPVTLAQYLFKFGFLFPPFWILGAIVLLSPLTVPTDFEPSKSETDRERMVCIMRDAELRWAKRCAWAVVLLLVVAGLATAIALVVMYS